MLLTHNRETTRKKKKNHRFALQHGGGGKPTGTHRRAGEGIPSGAQPGRFRLRYVAGGHGEGDGRAAANAPERVGDAGKVLRFTA